MWRCCWVGCVSSVDCGELFQFKSSWVSIIRHILFSCHSASLHSIEFMVWFRLSVYHNTDRVVPNCLKLSGNWNYSQQIEYYCHPCYSIYEITCRAAKEDWQAECSRRAASWWSLLWYTMINAGSFLLKITYLHISLFTFIHESS